MCICTCVCGILCLFLMVVGAHEKNKNHMYALTGRTDAAGEGGEGQEDGKGGEEEVEVEAGVEPEDGAEPQQVDHAGEARGEEDVHCL